MGFPITGQHYNLISMAFYLGNYEVAFRTFTRIYTVYTGYIVWEFPTVYIAQKLKLAKYLGEWDIRDPDKN
jgi:hypothetical protein